MKDEEEGGDEPAKEEEEDEEKEESKKMKPDTEESEAEMVVRGQPRGGVGQSSTSTRRPRQPPPPSRTSMWTHTTVSVITAPAKRGRTSKTSKNAMKKGASLKHGRLQKRALAKKAAEERTRRRAPVAQLGGRYVGLSFPSPAKKRTLKRQSKGKGSGNRESARSADFSLSLTTVSGEDKKEEKKRKTAKGKRRTGRHRLLHFLLLRQHLPCCLRQSRCSTPAAKGRKKPTMPRPAQEGSRQGQWQQAAPVSEKQQECSVLLCQRR